MAAKKDSDRTPWFFELAVGIVGILFALLPKTAAAAPTSETRPTPDVESLRRVLWESANTNSDRANVILGTMGDVDYSARGLWRFQNDGVWFRLGHAAGSERIVAVELRDGSDGKKAYLGKLPLGLQFGLERAAAEKLLGEKPCPPGPSCLCRAHGLELLYDKDAGDKIAEARRKLGGG